MHPITEGVEMIRPGHDLWSAFLGHLERSQMARQAVDEKGYPLPAHLYLGLTIVERVVGHVTVTVRDIVVPATEWTGGKETPLVDEDGDPLRELFVQTFAVDPDYRGQGYGRMLQEAALQIAEDKGCYQMRSWSSLDKHANFALKIRMGFAAHPTTYQLPDGNEISGVFFIKQLK